MQSIFLPERSPLRQARAASVNAVSGNSPPVTMQREAADVSPLRATSPLLPREVPFPQPVLPVIRDVYLRRRRVEEITGLKTPTLYRYMKQGLFPRPHKLGPNTVGWPSSAVLAWFNSRTAA